MTDRARGWATCSSGRNPVAPFIDAVRDVLFTRRRPLGGPICSTSVAAGAGALARGPAALPPDGARPGGDPVIAPGEVVLDERHPLVLACATTAAARSRSCSCAAGAARGRPAVHALRRGEPAGRRRARRWGSSGATARARPPRCAAWPASCRSTRAGRSAAGAWSRCSSSARASGRTSRAARTSTSTAPCTASGARRSRSASSAIIEFSELGEFIDLPVKVYSSGMYLRLGFSIVAHLDADVMLIDEILAVGDESFQRKCLARISERMEAGATLVLVSHDPSAIERVCRRVVVLDDGRVVFDGDVADGLLAYHRLLGTRGGRARAACAPARPARVEVAELELRDADGAAAARVPPGRGAARGDACCARSTPPSARWPRSRCATAAGETLLSHRRRGGRGGGRGGGVLRRRAPRAARRRLRRRGGRRRAGRAGRRPRSTAWRASRWRRWPDGEGVADLRGDVDRGRRTRPADGREGRVSEPEEAARPGAASGGREARARAATPRPTAGADALDATILGDRTPARAAERVGGDRDRARAALLDPPGGRSGHGAQAAAAAPHAPVLRGARGAPDALQPRRAGRRCRSSRSGSRRSRPTPRHRPNPSEQRPPGGRGRRAATTP